jgi:soluble lytic murein transglycosylase
MSPAFPPGLADGLWRAGLPGEAIRWDPAGMPLGDPEAALWSARGFDRLGAPWLAIRTADAAWRMAGSDVPARGFPEPLLRTLHPLPYPKRVWDSAVGGAVPWALLAGVAREESRWDPTVVSRVGARGLMQLMPATAAATAERLGHPALALDDLFDPAVGLELGAAELSRLYAVFKGQVAPVVAAYNAGEVQAKLWLDQCGSPCPSEWYVANITFTATAGYARDVLAAADTYVDLYGPGGPNKEAAGR